LFAAGIDLAYTSWETGDAGLAFYLEKEPTLEPEGIKIEHTKTKWFKDSNVWYIFFNKDTNLSSLTSIIRMAYRYITRK